MCSGDIILFVGQTQKNSWEEIARTRVGQKCELRKLFKDIFLNQRSTTKSP